MLPTHGESGRKSVNDMTIVDIANIAGVSVSTVSRVMNNHPDVSAKTREKVMAVIKRNSYIPNNSARNLKRESMKAIGVVVKGFSNPFFMEMLTVIQKELEQNRYTMMLHQIDPRQDEVDAAISLYKEKKPRGLIFMGGNFEHTRDKLALLDVPYMMLTITMQKNVDRTSFSSVSVDDYRAAYDITRHIIKSGHRHLAAISSNADDISISRLRIDGFRQAMIESGLEFDDGCVSYAGAFTRMAGYNSAKHLLERRDISCLFCISDLIALGAIRAIHDSGRSVPDDISVIGFDGVDEGRYSIPSLASVKQPDKKMAHMSVKILLDHIRNGSEHKHLTFETTFSEGESFKPYIDMLSEPSK